MHAKTLQHSRPVFAERLAAWTNFDAVDMLQRTLGGWIEDTKAVYFIAEEVNSDRIWEIGRPYIDDTAATGKCSWPAMMIPVAVPDRNLSGTPPPRVIIMLKSSALPAG